jgi:hypothetical protein
MKAKPGRPPLEEGRYLRGWETDDTDAFGELTSFYVERALRRSHLPSWMVDAADSFVDAFNGSFLKHGGLPWYLFDQRHHEEIRNALLRRDAQTYAKALSITARTVRRLKLSPKFLVMLQVASHHERVEAPTKKVLQHARAEVRRILTARLRPKRR